jgi:hypothetical protein
LKRKCEQVLLSENGRRAIYVDSENKKEILEFLNQTERYQKKFRFISDLILQGIRNTQVYDKEEIHAGCKDVTAMKFFKGQENARIYCKEKTDITGTFIVIASVLHEKKKSNKLSSKEINLIEKVASYEYEI